MKLTNPRRGRRLAMSACAAALLAAAPAAAVPVVSDLRVEAGGTVLTSSSYITDTNSFPTDTTRPACGGTGQPKTVAGPTALGLLGSAGEIDGDLRPVRVSDKFSFGLLLCGVGQFLATDSAFWLYKVNHVAPEVGAEASKLTGGEDVLFFLQDTALKRNTGDELVVDAPARARPGEVQVTVSAYAFNGARKPAAGARVFLGGSSATADATGRARIAASESGYLRAGRGGDIPSAPVRICVAADLADCPAVRGKRIFGSVAADRLKGTPGADVVRSGARNDRIDVRGGEDDRVRCGTGVDRVRMDGGDRATGDCEVVNGRRRSTRG